MTHSPPTFLYRSFLILITGALLLQLQGCAQTTTMEYGDVSDLVWFKTSSEIEGVEGFFTGKDGQLLFINSLPIDGLSWELKDNQLVLWSQTEDQLMPQSVRYQPLVVEGKLFLATPLSAESPAYSAATLQEPRSNVNYFPTYPRELLSGSQDREAPVVYLQLDTVDKSLRGYGGVNNFYGSYQLKGAAGFKAGPIASTLVARPGMDSEITFMMCLEQADAILSVSTSLYFYQGSRLLCSFSAD